MSRFAHCVTLIILMLTLASPAQGQDAALLPPPPENALVDPQYADLVEEVDRLKARLSTLETSADKTSAMASPAFRPQEASPGIIPESKRKWDVKLGGVIDGDYINWVSADESIDDAHDYFEFRRLRLTADGTGYEVYEFRLQLTLEEESMGNENTTLYGEPEIKDAFFSIKELPVLGKLRVGNFFVPFGLEQSIGGTNLTFLERSIPTQNVFTVSREVGIASYNSTEDEMITWTGGVFFDSISDASKERIDDNQGVRVSGRVTWLPVYEDDGETLIHTGAGILFTNDQDGRYRLSARPQIHDGPRLIDTGALLADSYVTGNLEFAVVNGPFSVQSEAYLSQVNLSNQDSQLTYGAYLFGSYFLTGEHRKYETMGMYGAAFGRVTPNSMVFAKDGCRGWGAWELKARYSYLGADELGAGHYNDFTFGVNWYWSDHVRMQLDWIHPMTSEETVYGATTSNILATRFDVNW
ncbi:OprO/OprP family phosphate-selective porin [Lacunimicrobium album]